MDFMKNVFNNTYGLARTVIAAGNLATFSLTDFSLYFDKDIFLVKPSGTLPNFFYIFGESGLLYSQIISIIILLWVMSGYLPQITGMLHAWVVYSFSTFSLLVEGGDQISQIILILLIPVTLFDKRINHWDDHDFFSYRRSDFFGQFSYSCILMIQLQICILYFFSFVEKFKVAEWRNGSVFYYWYNHHPFGANEFIHAILNPFIDYKIVYIAITWSVLLLEVLLAGAILSSAKFKKNLFYFAFAFHFMIWIIHGLASFYIAMVGGLIIYLLPADQSIDFRRLFGFSNKKLKKVLLKN